MTFFKKYRIHILVGSLAGIINGFLGAGGGIIVTYFLTKALTKEEKKNNGIFANAVATMLPLSILSLGIYLFKGHINPDTSLLSFIIPAFLGGALGAHILTKIKLNTAKTIFSILVIISGVIMIIK